MIYVLNNSDGMSNFYFIYYLHRNRTNHPDLTTVNLTKILIVKFTKERYKMTEPSCRNQVKIIFN